MGSLQKFTKKLKSALFYVLIATVSITTKKRKTPPCERGFL
jgi:hypothetical protein